MLTKMNWNLQELCLRRIIEQFEIYTMFYASNDVKLKHLFEFLLGMYSEEIISELYHRKQLQPMYVDILMNKYLTRINTDWFQTDCWKIISAKMAAIGFTLKKLLVHRSNGELPWKNALCYLPNLEIIHFQDGGCSDEALKCIAEFCPNVEEIRVGGTCNITIIGIKHLGMKENGIISCPKLKRLSVCSTNISMQDIKYILENFPYFEDFAHWDLPLVLFERHRKDVLETHKTVSYNLTCLWIPDIRARCPPSDYDDLLKVCFSVCPHLKELQCDILSKKNLDTLSNLRNLTKLDVHCYQNPGINLNDLLNRIGSTLKSLTLSSCTVSVPVLAESCPLLEELKVLDVDFQTDNESSVREFHQLSSCSFHDLSHNSMIQQACSLLSASYRVTHVHFSDCNIFSEMEAELLEAFSHCPLKSIDFGNAFMDFDLALKILTSCPNLSVIILPFSFQFNPEYKKVLSATVLTLPRKPFVHFG